MGSKKNFKKTSGDVEKRCCAFHNVLLKLLKRIKHDGAEYLVRRLQNLQQH